MADMTSTALKVLSQAMSTNERIQFWMRKAQKMAKGTGSVTTIPANKQDSSSTGTIETSDYTVIGPEKIQEYVNNNSIPFISVDLGTEDAELVYKIKQLEPGIYTLHFTYVMECATTSSVVTVTAEVVDDSVSPEDSYGSQEVEIDESNIPSVTQAGRLLIPHGYINSGATAKDVTLKINLSGVFSSSDCTQFTIIGFISLNRTEVFTDYEDVDDTSSKA
jgi:hypothetical protein